MQVDSAVELHLHVTPILLRWSPGLKTLVTHKMDIEGDTGVSFGSFGTDWAQLQHHK